MVSQIPATSGQVIPNLNVKEVVVNDEKPPPHKPELPARRRSHDEQKMCGKDGKEGSGCRGRWGRG